MDTEKEYAYPYVICSGHLQGVCVSTASTLSHVAYYLEDDLYTLKELKEKLNNQIKILEKADKDVNLLLKNHYARKSLTESDLQYAKQNGLSIADMVSFKQDMEKEVEFEIKARQQEDSAEAMQWANPEVD